MNDQTIPAAARPCPRPALLDRLTRGTDVIGIVHWGLNTFTGREWGLGDEDPALLAPAAFDADQIAGACKAGGDGGLVVVAKHHDGFCLWPTKTTDHKTPGWRFEASAAKGGETFNPLEGWYPDKGGKLETITVAFGGQYARMTA